ncbi:uncharacterized protein [Centruroides vittatus]|uniref:uncharacterized protein n=1 Tax=Centruroides vittatus TaxID=120091 RepID=UPI00350FA737
MKRETYEKGLKEYIDATQCNQVGSNWVEKLHSRVKRLSCSKLAKKLELKNITMDTPDVPKLFAFAKTHKEGQQFRPVVDKTKAPTRKLEKAIHNIIVPHMSGYQFTISNPEELIIQLKQITSPAYITVLDFKSLYPSIKIPPCFCALRDFLFTKVNDTALHQNVLELAHLMCYGSVFQFKNVTYTQSRGVPMGSPLSGDLCELVVRQLESKTLPGFTNDILLYRRYIDDVIIVWKTTPNLAQFVEKMNDNTYGLSIEVEQHSDTNVHFLDVDIRIDSHNIHTSVYRKQCASPTYIPSDSCDPIQYKIAAFRSLVRRAYTHSSTQQALKKELKHIEKIADIHGYRNIIPRMAERQRARMSQNAPAVAQRCILHNFSILQGDETSIEEERLVGVPEVPVIENFQARRDAQNKRNDLANILFARRIQH